MICSLSRLLGAITLSLSLTALASIPPAAAQSPFDETEIRLLIRGMNPSQAMADEDALGDTLNAYGVPRPENANLGQWIAAIRTARSDYGAPVLRGVGGIPARALLWVADKTVGANAFPPTVETTGRIEPTCDGEPGYYYDNLTGSGHLCVTMFSTFDPPGPGPAAVTRAERFFVEVTNGFQVEDKDPRNPGNVFPRFTQASGLSIGAAVADGFSHKLWASGTSIRITKIWRDMNYNPDNPHFVRVNPNIKQYKHLFEPDPDACVDMMFDGPPPSPTLEPGTAPPQYCLGRCKNPPIINTR